MQDSDDYFDDDFVLDETTLAILDAEELKRSITQSSANSSRPVKRQKTTHAGWGGLAGRSSVEDDFEDMPEISLRNDGSYGIRGSQGLDVLVHANNSVSSTTSFAMAPNSLPKVPLHTENVIHSSPSRRASTPSSLFQRSRSIHESVGAAARAPTANPPSRFDETLGTPLLQHHHSPASTATHDRRLKRDLDILRVRVDELQRRAEEAEKAAKEAEIARLTKEGEVSILRKGIEKTAREHAANLQKLKSAKEAAEAAQSELQKEMKEDMERLRTEFMFKQHELETSFRKVPGTVRSSRISRDMPSTPVQNFSITMPQSSARKYGASNLSPFVHRIPQPKFGEVVPGPSKHPRIPQETPKKSTALPGFHNSFVLGAEIEPKITTSKLDSPVYDRKGKGRQIPSPSLFNYPSQPLNNEPIPSPPSSPIARTQVGLVEDVVMGDAENDDLDAPDEARMELQDVNGDAAMDVTEEPDPLDFTIELRRIMFSHSRIAKSLTLHMLLSAPLPDTLPPPERDNYLTTCSSLLQMLGTTSTSDWETLARSVSDKLLKLIRPLDFSNLITHLTTLLDLLVLLCFSFPSFCTALVSSSDAANAPTIVPVLCDLIRNQLEAPKIAAGDEQQDLAWETISLMEALCFNVDKTFERHLADMLTAPDVVTVLLDSAQPSWLLYRQTRMMVLVASRESASRHLLSFSLHDRSGEEGEAGREQLKSHIERLCAILANTSHLDVDTENSRVNILTFFAMLSVADRDAVTMLLESATLVPTLVSFATRLTIPLWEEEPKIDNSNVDLQENVRTVYQTLFLLHYLVCSRTDHPYNLRDRLHHAPHRQFNGLIHMFIVTFGRLSYADAPEWLPSELRNEVEDMTEMARDLLELVVEGPELDSIYIAYQGEDSETDDDEIEARNLETNLLE